MTVATHCFVIRCVPKQAISSAVRASSAPRRQRRVTTTATRQRSVTTALTRHCRDHMYSPSYSPFNHIVAASTSIILFLCVSPLIHPLPLHAPLTLIEPHIQCVSSHRMLQTTLAPTLVAASSRSAKDTTVPVPAATPSNRPHLQRRATASNG